MRVGLILLALLFAAIGAVFGALNGERVAYDFYFVVVHAPKGAALLCALVVGWLVGGVLVYCALVLRLRRRVRALSRQLQHDEQATRIDTEKTASNDEA
ncbi:MAG: lipopolysaccharide assembly protein LapA domain-containing protein [Rudaea sp.]